MTVIVTGGAGFIGKHLVERLRTQGESVFVLDNYSRGEPVGAVGKFDVADPDEVYSAFIQAGCHEIAEVIHLAYINGTKTFYERPYDVLQVATRGMLNVIWACKTFNVKKLTLMSSSEVCRFETVDVGEATPLVIPDPFNPRYSYSAGKMLSEMMAIHCGQFDRLQIARPFNIYGPGMSLGHVIPDFIAQAETEPHVITMLGTGDETRSFCYIDDFIDGFMLMREKGESWPASKNCIYNIGTPVETTIRELAHKILHLAKPLKSKGHHVIKVAGGLREGDLKRRKPDVTRLAALGYAPRVSLDEGLRRMIQ